MPKDAGYPLVIREKEGYGYIDRQGRVIIEPQYSLAMDFSDGRALVKLDWEPSYRIVIDVVGETIFEIAGKNKNADVEFSDGMLKVEEWKEMYLKKIYYLDTMGNIIIEKDVREAMEFKCGLARITGFNAHL